MKTYVYIDAFNIYFGCVKNTPHKWLDLSKLCAILLPQHQIERIKYFTAHVRALPTNPDAPRRQQVYLRALGTLTNLRQFTVISESQRKDAAGSSHGRTA